LGLTIAVTAALIVICTGVGKHRNALPWPTWALALFALLPMGQLVPLPMEWLEVISPTSASLYQDAIPNLKWAPISVDATATSNSALHQLAFVSVFLMVVLMGRRHIRFVTWSIAFCATLCALVGLAQTLMGVDKIFGVYDALHRESLTGFFGPFVNPNTFAGLLVLGAFISVGLALEDGETKSSKLAVLMSMICLVGCFCTGSRGGQAAAVFGWILLVFLTVSIPRDERPGLFARMKKVSAGLGIGLAVGVITAVSAMAEWKGLEPSRLLDDKKLQAWSVLDDYLEQFGIVGSGRGTFGSVFHQFQESPINGSVTHAENYIVQCLGEFGLVIGLAILTTAILIWVSSLRNFWKRPQALTAGAVTGVGAVGFQQCFDFGMESMGLSLATAAALAVSFTSRPRDLPRRRAYGIIAGLVGSMVLGLLFYGPKILETQSDAHLNPLKSAQNEADVERIAQRLVGQHPVDPMIPLLAAHRLADMKSVPLKTTLKWANMAQRRAPKQGVAHEIAARALYRAKKKNQAAGEFRRAVEKSPWRALALTATIARLFDQPGNLLAAVPATRPARARLLESLFRLGKNTHVLAVTNELLLWEAKAEWVHVLRARACLKTKDEDCVEKEIKWLDEHGMRAQSAAFSARLWIRRSDGKRATAELERGLKLGGHSDASYLRQAIRAYVTLKAFKSARKCLDILWRINRIDHGKAIEFLMLKASVETRAGRPSAAIDAYDRAFTLEPTPIIVEKAVGIEDRLGRVNAAQNRLDDALKRWPKNRRLKALRETRARRIRIKKETPE